MYLTFNVYTQFLCQRMEALGGGGMYFVSLSRMITDTFLTEMPVSDIAGIKILDNNERNNADNYIYNMTTS